jgi:hypothetical protein
MASSTHRSWPVVRGALTGVVAFLAGYLVTYVWQAPRVRDSLQGINAILEFFGGESLPAWKAVGWLFFNAHYVRTQLPGFGGPQTRNFIAAGDAPTLLYAVPVVVLFAAGFLVAWSRRTGDARDGALDGATVAIGYAVAATVAVFLVGATRGDASIAPDPVTGVLLAGVVYPLVLGGTGGALAGLVASARRPSTEPRG